MFLLILFFLANSAPRNFSFYYGSTPTSECRNLNTDINFFNVNESIDFSSVVSNKINISDTEITFCYNTEVPFRIPLKIFNDKKFNLLVNTRVSGILDFTGVHNLVLNISSMYYYTSSKYNITFTGSHPKPDKTSITITNINLRTESNDIFIDTLTIKDPMISPSSLKAHTLYFSDKKAISVTHRDNCVVVSGIIVYLIGPNPLFSVECTHYYGYFFPENTLYLFNEAEKSNISFEISRFDRITISGNKFLDSNVMKFSLCKSVRIKTSSLFIDSISFYKGYNRFFMNISNSVKISGPMTLISTSEVYLNLTDKGTSKVSVEFDKIITDWSRLIILSSFIDVHIHTFEFTFKEETNLEYFPTTVCFGYGGASLVTIDEFVTFSDIKKFDFPEYQVDFKGFQSDESLSELVSKNLNVITVKSHQFDSSMFDTFFRFLEYKEKEGFDNLLHFNISLENGFVLSLHCSSFSTIPFEVQLTDGSSYGSSYVISDISELSKAIQKDTKFVILTIEKNVTFIDLSFIQKKIQFFTISSYYKYPLRSMKSNSNIDHLIFCNCYLDTGTYEIDSNQLTLDCNTFDKNSSLNFVFLNDQMITNIYYSTFRSIMQNFVSPFPLVRVFSYTGACTISDDFFLTDGNYDVPIPRKIVPNLIIESYSQDISIILLTKSLDFFKLRAINTHNDRKSVDITINNLDNVTSIGSFSIEMVNYTGINRITLNDCVWKDKLTIKGDKFTVNNQAINQRNIFCVCKEEEEVCNEICEEGSVLITTYDLSTISQKFSEGKALIQIVGSEKDDDYPILPYSSINKNCISIVGSGVNPRIKIDCSSDEIINNLHEITFSQITVDFQSSSNDLRLYKATFLKDSQIDSTLSNEQMLTIDFLDCYSSHLVFKTIFIKVKFHLSDSPELSESFTKVAFAPYAVFMAKVPSLVTFSGPKMLISNLEFDLTDCSPIFVTSNKFICILGNDGNIDAVMTNISISAAKIEINGTWTSEHPKRFFDISYSKLDLYLEAVNAPLYFRAHDLYINLESERTSINGELYVIDTWNSEGACSINSVINKRTSFRCRLIQTKTTYIGQGVDLILEKYYSMLKFHIGLNNFGSVEIENDPKCAIRCDASFGFSGNYLIPEVVDFLNRVNYSVITIDNAENIEFTDIYVSHGSLYGFYKKNFKFTAIGNKIYFGLAENPEISLALLYSNTEKKEYNVHYGDIPYIHKFIPIPNATIEFTTYTNLSEIFFNFDIVNVTIYQINFISLDGICQAAIKFGNNVVSNLYLKSMIIDVPENDVFTIEKINLTQNSVFTNLSKYDSCIKSVSFDFNSLIKADLSNFSSELNFLSFDNYETLKVYFTTTGVTFEKIEGYYDKVTRIAHIDFSKCPNVNLIIYSDESPFFSIEDDVVDFKPMKSVHLFSNNFHFGSNFNKFLTPANFVIGNTSIPHSIHTNSFPLFSLDFMYKYPIYFGEHLYPITFPYKFILNNENLNIVLNYFTDYWNITFNEVISSDNSSIFFDKKPSDKVYLTKNINNINVINGTLELYNQTYITNEISLGKGSILCGNFTCNQTLKTINLEWDLNEAPFLNTPLLTNLNNTDINIIYTGESIEGREKEFDKFLSKGIILMKRIDFNDVFNHIHFISINHVKEFEEGENLSIKCRYIYDQSIQLITTRYFSPESEIVDNETIPEVTPTHVPTESFSPDFPTTDSFISSNSNIKFTDDGFIDGNTFISTANNKNVLFIKSDKQHINLSVEVNSKPNENLFVSPQKEKVVIFIDSPESEDYGTGQLGVHANSNNVTINLPQSKVPLNVFNDEFSEINFQLNDENELILISLHKLTISNGNIVMNLPQNSKGIEFVDVETFLNDELKSMYDQISIETKIGSLLCNSGSSIKMTNVSFNKQIVTSSHSKIEIEKKVTFNSQTKLELFENSFIELGKSQIDGIADEIKIIRENSARSSLNEEIEAKLICGANFDCDSWIEKYSKDEFYKNAKCIENDYKEKCFVASNTDKSSPKKKSPSTAVIAVIVVVVLVVVIAAVIIAIVIILKKKKSTNDLSEKEAKEEDNASDTDSPPGITEYV